MPSDALQGVALVTGGGRGIGASIARELAAAGVLDAGYSAAVLQHRLVDGLFGIQGIAQNEPSEPAVFGDTKLLWGGVG